MVDLTAQRFGLPPCLWIPIAAASEEAIEAHVGPILRRHGRSAGRANALLVETADYPPRKSHNVRLWSHADAAAFEARLYPRQQVWVHVDDSNYRAAFLALGGPGLTPGAFLDHVQNREAIRLRDNSHPAVRLCPVSRAVNTSGGHRAGGEGMEKEYLRSMPSQPAAMQARFAAALRSPIVYADPMDLTKMLDIAPGTQVLNGVRDTQQLFYPG